ncbi:DUF3015 family protein [Alteromonas lipolytica]|uniref:DUF3015 domain-containing protein n=1 Tax=Alteromonas lipolytica TaxID=1856405 RepID=A0A1E8FI48_9ALTE|nr:DUF3015 family protein [Alteromonas lipolytica]OFI35579.1 DUF3015 domain-containing protein [Alteromonas lipolytica]GGF77356.1 hypothetical protein GCM10011338_32080 [Alteromonas lipolytica]
MFKKLTMAAALMTATLSGQTMAQENINPWKHCGIGAIIFDDNGTAAAISNIIWDLGTTAVSSKVSSADSCSGKLVTAAVFIQDNFKKVMEETSQGEGEHLVAMMDILQVEQAQRSQVIAAVRADMAKAVAANAETSPEIYYNAVVASI